MLAAGSTVNSYKDIILVGVVTDEYSTKFIGFSYKRLVKCVLNDDLMRNNVVNPDDCDKVPLYTPHKSVRTNQLFYVSAYANMHIFVDGHGDMIALHLDEIENLKKNGVFIFKNCRISVTTPKKRGSLSAGSHSFSYDTGKSYFTTPLAYQQIFESSTPVDNIRCPIASICQTIISTRLLEAFVNRYILLSKMGKVGKNKAEEYILNIKNSINIGNTILKMYFDYGVQNITFFGELYCKLKREESVVLHISQLVNKYDQSVLELYTDDNTGLKFLLWNTHGIISISKNGEKLGDIRHIALEILANGDSIKYIIYAPAPDKYSVGARFHILIKNNGVAEYKADSWNSSIYRNGSRASMTLITDITNSEYLDMYKKKPFEFNCFVERNAEILFKEFKYRSLNANSFEQSNYRGITSEDFIKLLEREEVNPGKNLNNKQPDSTPYKIERLNRYEFVKYFHTSNPGDMTKPKYFEVYSGGKVIKSGYTLDIEYGNHLDYNDISSLANWHTDLIKLNYKQFAGKKRVTLDNRIYSDSFMRNIYSNRSYTDTYIQFYGLPGYVFGICLRQDILTGIYYLCYRVSTENNIDQIVTHNRLKDINKHEIQHTTGYLKICAFKDRNYAISTFDKIKKLIDNRYVAFIHDDMDPMIDAFKQYISSGFTESSVTIAEKDLKNTNVLTILFNCYLNRQGTEKLLTLLFGDNLGIIGD